ncbi:MAG: hypothetical protein A3F41_06445 [Coxiella sp. RIFCSPHIGHO2_12_FULL_44_14]|nr:MAG: hypothetical protein A3F41_06445 [Coxiella sp. RIFCSPHIGHO2_12_FULL_44_14]
MDDKHQLIVLLTLLIVPLSGLGIDIFVPSLPAITDHFSADTSVVQLSVSVYILGYALFQTIWGTLADSFGRRRLILIGLSGVTITCLLIPFSINIGMLLGLRFLQGVFVEPVGILSRVLLSDTFKGNELSRFSNYLTITWAIGPIIAPFIGGYLQNYLGWKASFFFLAAYSFILLIILFIKLPETHTNPIPLVFSCIKASYQAVLTHSEFLSLVIVMSLSYGAMAIFNVMGPFLIQTTLGFSAITFGYVALYMGVAWFIGSLFNRWLTSRYPIDAIVIVTFVFLLIAEIALLLFSFFSFQLWTLITPTWLIFMTSSIIFSNLFARCMVLFKDKAGTSSGVMGTLFSGGAGVISALASLLHTQTPVPMALSYLALLVVCLVLYGRVFIQSRWQG